VQPFTDDAIGRDNPRLLLTIVESLLNKVRLCACALWALTVRADRSGRARGDVRRRYKRQEGQAIGLLLQYANESFCQPRYASETPAEAYESSLEP
jgi:hypothetical protein